MKKELGKWLMDIAKYITTAVILTSIFGDIEERWLVYTGGTITIIVVLSWGLFLGQRKIYVDKTSKSCTFVA